MSISEDIRLKARENIKKIVLPEGEEPRMIQAAKIISQEKFAELVFLGKENRIKELAAELNYDFPSHIKIIDPHQSNQLDNYAETYAELRKHKGMTIEKAKELMKDPLYYGSMMVYQDHADGCGIDSSYR